MHHRGEVPQALDLHQVGAASTHELLCGRLLRLTARARVRARAKVRARARARARAREKGGGAERSPSPQETYYLLLTAHYVLLTLPTTYHRLWELEELGELLARCHLLLGRYRGDIEEI